MSAVSKASPLTFFSVGSNLGKKLSVTFVFQKPAPVKVETKPKKAAGKVGFRLSV